jgi:hypothetical protein
MTKAAGGEPHFRRDVGPQRGPSTLSIGSMVMRRLHPGTMRAPIAESPFGLTPGRLGIHARRDKCIDGFLNVKLDFPIDVR